MSNMSLSGQQGSPSSMTYLGSYEEPIGTVWYGHKRAFANVPIDLTTRFTNRAGHIFDDEPDWHPPHESLLKFEHLRWPKLYDRRCDAEVLCRYHRIPVPRARSSELCVDKTQDHKDFIDLLEEEIAQMDKRLTRYHDIQYVRTESYDVQRAYLDIIENEDLQSDTWLSDYTHSVYDPYDEDDIPGPDAPILYLPECLILAGTPLCCGSRRWSSYYL